MLESDGNPVLLGLWEATHSELLGMKGVKCLAGTGLMGCLAQ